MEIQWNGTKTLRIDADGVHWGQALATTREEQATPASPCGPYSLHDRRFCMTIYNPSASTEWSGRHGGEPGQKGMTESLDVHFDENGGGQGNCARPLTFRGQFQRQFEGPLPCTGQQQLATVAKNKS